MEHIGVDIIEIPRIEQALERWGNRFLNRVYTSAELAQLGHRKPSLAACFAAKEATMKALGTGRRGVGWREVEVIHAPSGQPRLRLSGRAQHRARALGIRSLAVSLSHCRDYALASVVGTSDESGHR
ncbi:MAG TPA: holo-[acyl-carrier-protein] synthase [Dehalococcoidia bacterium]|nr:holo-[acyl-carrier-protein] synthase [Dehalococcoidia bacterium]